MMCPQYVFGVSHLYNLGEPFDTTTNKRIQKKLLALLAISLLVVTASCSDSNQSTTTVFTQCERLQF